MRNRRMIAYGIDVVLFVVISLLVLFLFRGIANGFLRFIVNLLGLLVVYGVVYGLVSTYLRGSIGKKLMDLKVMPTVGMMTPIRLLLRDAVSKYIAFLPLVLGIMGFINAEFPTSGVRSSGVGAFTTGIVFSLVLLGVLAGANAYMYVKEKQLLVDVLFHTNVENDIPTATEYQDLSAFLDRENEA
jgi:RDD family.